MKRFTETQKWQDAWFMDLPAKWKLAWFWILDNCDHAGIVEANPRLMAFVIGEAIDGDEFIRAMGGRVTKPKLGKWFVPKFIEFQYGTELNPQNSAHKGVLRKLEDAGIDCPVKVLQSPSVAPAKGLPSPCQGAQDKDKDKDKEQDSSEAADEPAFPDPLNVPEFHVAWLEWLKYRRERKLPTYKPTALKTQIKTLAAWGVDGAIASINESIRQNWQGLFEPKQANGQRTQPASTRTAAQSARVASILGYQEGL